MTPQPGPHYAGPGCWHDACQTRARDQRHRVPRFVHSPSLHRYVVPERQIVELLATVASLNMHVRPEGATLIGESPAAQGTPRPRHSPSSQRNCVPAWQLAAPDENEMPLNWHVLESAICPPGHATPSGVHSPSAHR